jgi:hypothetical protein
VFLFRAERNDDSCGACSGPKLANRQTDLRFNAINRATIINDTGYPSTDRVRNIPLIRRLFLTAAHFARAPVE